MREGSVYDHQLQETLGHAGTAGNEQGRTAPAGRLVSGNLSKLRRNQSVSMEVLLKIAETLDCNIGDMMDFVKAVE